MIVGEADLDIHAKTDHVDDELRSKLNVIAARAGDRFGTLLGRAISSPFRSVTQRGVHDGTSGGGWDLIARRSGDRFGSVMGRALATPFRLGAQRAATNAGRVSGVSFGRALRAALGGAIIVSAIHELFDQFRKGFAEFSAGEQGVAQLNAALQSTGRVAGITTAELERQADVLMRLTGVDDDLVLHAEGLLLTFTRVRNIAGEGNDIFTRALTASRDLSVRGFGDLNSSAIQLGKALNDPIRGVLALSRTGIQFSAGQKRTILTLIETNRVLDAQKIILGEVEKQVGGSGRAFGRTFPGQIATTRERLNNLRGEIVARFVPALMQGLGATNSFLDDIEAHPEKIDRVVRLVSGFIRGWALGIRDLFVNMTAVIEANRGTFDRVQRGIRAITGGEVTTGLQTTIGTVGYVLGALVVLVAKVADAFLTLSADIGKGLGQGLMFIARFVRGAISAFDKVLRAAEIMALATGNVVAARGLDNARKRLDTSLGGMVDSIERYGQEFYDKGVALAAALDGGLTNGLLDQAAHDTELRAALDTLINGPEGVGISSRELNKYADGATLRESFFAGLSDGSAADGSDLLDDFDERLREAQDAAGDRAREIGETITDGLRDQVERVQKEVSALTAQRDKILDFRGSVLSAVVSFTRLSDLIDDPSTSTAGRIAKSLSNRLLGLQTFARNLQTLAKRGLDRGVIAELAVGGPEQRALSSALVAGTDEQLRAINATEKAVRAQAQVVAKIGTDTVFGPGALAKTNSELSRLNAKIDHLNKQIELQPKLIAKAVDAARKNATVATKTSTRTAVTP